MTRILAMITKKHVVPRRCGVRRLFLRPIVFPRRSLLAAGLTGAGIIGTLAYPWPPIAYSEPFRPEGNTVQGIDIPSLTATTTHNVANASQLSSAINTINTTSSAGHHIVLANGSYSGNYTIYAQGTQANPIVIRPANFLGATLTGALTIIGSWVIVYGLNTANIDLSAATVSSTLYVANNCRVSRCLLTGGDIIGMELGASYNCVDRNSISGGKGRLLEMRSSETISFRNCFIWNHCFGSAGTNSSNPIPVQATALSYERHNDDLQCLFAWNLVENNGYSIGMQIKGSGVTFLQNTIRNSGKTAISCRHGRNHRILGNWLPNGGVGVRGDDALIEGNINSPGGGDRYSANTGNIANGSLGEPTTELRPGWTFARRAKFIGNTGPLRIGYESSNPYQPVDCLIEAHTGSISIYSGATGTIDRRNAAPSMEVTPAFELTAAQVGPYS